MLEKPRWPPALGPSTTIKSAVVFYFLSHRLSIKLQAFADETIGAILTLESLVRLGNLFGIPAPDIIRSTFEFTHYFTYSS